MKKPVRDTLAFLRTSSHCVIAKVALLFIIAAIIEVDKLLLHFIRRQRRIVNVPLHDIAALHLQVIELLLVFDTFCNHTYAELSAHADHAVDQGGISSAMRQAADENLVDLEVVHGKLREITQG